MYKLTFNDPQKAMWQTCHTYEQEIGYIQGLPAENDFPSILTKHRWSRLTGKRTIPCNLFQSLKGLKISTVVSELFYLIGPAILRNLSATTN